ncbi:class I SAM-dependent methyltransferase [Lentibacillus saliphilus]|uniref:class I SAM-dependent methyltransferase n=1 Tax=Lentibacillus saliphilus TaxID=2737028 RepID=UPI001C2FCD1B|nr:class I SAM-dependent methyltransferase [Lentibacillus saliphilus]
MNKTDIIPFYGGTHPELFEIERRCMDRPGKVIDFLDQRLPNGKIIDIGAGNGYTAQLLIKETRPIVALEPDEMMIDSTKPLIWAKGTAQQVPFHANTFESAYATWAFFFDGMPDVDKGLAEVERVVKPGGEIIIVDNYGHDEFCALSTRKINSNVDYWTAKGFDYTVIDTVFAFDSVEEARTLLSLYFGDEAGTVNQTVFDYKVVAYTKTNHK